MNREETYLGWRSLIDLTAVAGLHTAVIDLTAISMDFVTQVASVGYAATTLAGTQTAGSRCAIFDLQDQFGSIPGYVTIAFYGTAAADKQFTCEVYAWRNGAGAPGEPVFIGTADGCYTGTMDCTKYPATQRNGAATAGDTLANGFWVDTIAGTDCWPSGVTIGDSGNNRICTLTFDATGHRFIGVHLSDGDTAAVTSVGAVITGYCGP